MVSLQFVSRFGRSVTHHKLVAKFSVVVHCRNDATLTAGAVFEIYSVWFVSYCSMPTEFIKNDK